MIFSLSTYSEVSSDSIETFAPYSNNILLYSFAPSDISVGKSLVKVAPNLKQTLLFWVLTGEF